MLHVHTECADLLQSVHVTRDQHFWKLNSFEIYTSVLNIANEISEFP